MRGRHSIYVYPGKNFILNRRDTDWIEKLVVERLLVLFAYATTEMEEAMEITIGDDFIGVSISYNPYYIEELKKLGGRWQPREKWWVLPKFQEAAVIELFKREHIAPLFGASRKIQDEQLQSVENDMIRHGYSPNTIVNYLSHIRLFLNYSNGICTTETINGYMDYLLQKMDVSHSYCNQAINAIKIYARKYSRIDELSLLSLTRPKKQKKLPKVMAKSEVKRLLDATMNLKHKTQLMMAYSCGLRVSEVVNLKIADVDSARMVVAIRQGKGRKDRMVPLSKNMLEQLKTYGQVYKPREWVFENDMSHEPISVRTLQSIFHQSCNKAGISKAVTFHSLRHSYATHLLESGVDLRFIQELLGHSSSKTTEIYTHVSVGTLKNIRNPMDDLWGGE